MPIATQRRAYNIRMLHTSTILIMLFIATLASCAVAEPVTGDDGVLRDVLLPPGPGNARNSEGDFIQLKDGKILFIYSHYLKSAHDDGAAYLASRASTDSGKTWTQKDEIVVPLKGELNLMSVTLLRLKDGRIAMFYLRKKSGADCRPLVRFSTDEAVTWSEPVELIPNEVGYFVMNNSRVIQLGTGRFIVPLAYHTEKGKFTGTGKAITLFSDDLGATWKRSNMLTLDRKAGLQEPGVIPLKDGSLLMYCRTTAGVQYFSRSTDSGVTWSAAEPSNIRSPLSPASIKRIPKTGDLLLVWNDNGGENPTTARNRTPLSVAVSSDEGKTWTHKKLLERDPAGWYCYTAIEFVGDRVLLAHCSTGEKHYPQLSATQITSFDLAWLYKD